MAVMKCSACGGQGTVEKQRCEACRGNGLVHVADRFMDASADLRSILESVKVMPLRPGDVIICKVPAFLPAETAEGLRSNLSELFDSNPVLVLTGGIDIEVVRPEVSQ